MNILNLFRRKQQNAQMTPPHLPHTPAPPQSPLLFDDLPEDNGDFSETTLSVQRIQGRSIAFGEQKSIQMVNERAIELIQSQNHIAGTGKPMTKIEDVGGICPWCHAQALAFFKEGLISLQEMESRSMYDIHSSARCDSCGRNGCNHHIRPAQIPDGRILSLCITCQELLNRQLKKEKRKQFFKRTVTFLLSPFFSEEG